MHASHKRWPKSTWKADDLVPLLNVTYVVYCRREQSDQGLDAQVMGMPYFDKAEYFHTTSSLVLCECYVVVSTFRSLSLEVDSPSAGITAASFACWVLGTVPCPRQQPVPQCKAVPRRGRRDVRENVLTVWEVWHGKQASWRGGRCLMPVRVQEVFGQWPQ